MRRRTNEESAELRHERMLDALADLEIEARHFAAEDPKWTRTQRAALSKAAISYARRVRLLAGVR